MPPSNLSDVIGGGASADRSAYIELVCGEVLTAALPYAKWIDVLCEPTSPHALDVDESRQVLAAGVATGLRARVHGNQLAPGPGVQLAVEFGAASVDHCTYVSATDVEALVGAADTTVATLLPGVEFSTRSPFPDARALLDAGVSVALATDCNPGTCCSTSMPFVIAVAVREMGMTPAEAVRAATVTAAAVGGEHRDLQTGHRHTDPGKDDRQHGDGPVAPSRRHALGLSESGSAAAQV